MTKTPLLFVLPTEVDIEGLRCMEEGCGNIGFECYLPDDGDEASYAYCAEHAFDNGFCKRCGQFWAGIESFDFGKGYCDNCQYELDDETDDETDEWDGLVEVREIP